MTRIVGIAVLLFCIFANQSQGNDSSVEGQLEKITERGHMLAEYLTAVQWSSKAIRARFTNTESGLRYLAKRSDLGWTVAVGRLDRERNRFLIMYESVPSKSQPLIEQHDPPLQDTGFYLFAARAVSVASENLKPEVTGPYDYAVLPTDSGCMYVYLLPAQTISGHFILGHDVRYLVSPEGSIILEKHWMHKATIQFPSADNSRKVAAGVHSHVLTDAPEDSDVSYVLRRRPAIPEVIRTPNHVYVVHPDGAISESKK